MDPAIKDYVNNNSQGQIDADAVVSSITSEAVSSTLSLSKSVSASAATVTQSIPSISSLALSASIQSSIQSVVSSIASQTASPTLPIRFSATMAPSPTISPPLFPNNISSGITNDPNNLLLLSVMTVLFVDSFIYFLGKQSEIASVYLKRREDGFQKSYNSQHDMCSPKQIKFILYKKKVTTSG
jgi:hypothetical protein